MTRNFELKLAARYGVSEAEALDLKGISKARGSDRPNPIRFNSPQRPRSLLMEAILRMRNK